MDLVKTISTSFDSFSRRIIKVLRFGLSDVQQTFEASPVGIDSNPAKDLIAIYSDTSRNGESAIIGYIKKNQLADVGELRLFSTDNNNVQKFFVWLKNDGTIQIGGNNDNAVRYAALNAAIQTYLTALNTAIAAGVASGGGAYTPPSPLDISAAKINEIKTL